MKVLVDGQTLSTPEMERGIGVAFIRLLREVALPEVAIEWHVLVRDEAAYARLPADLAAACEPVVMEPLEAVGGQREWCEAYGARVQRVVEQLRPDWYWNPNPLMVNVHFPYGLQGVRTAWTLHDLIPLLYPQWYMNAWPDHVRSDYRARIEALAARADVLACVSAATAADFRRLNPEARCDVRTVHWGCEFTAMYPLRYRARDEERPYVLYVGGFDPRKNMQRAVRAFDRFVRTLEAPAAAALRLVLVAATSGPEAAGLLGLARELGLGDRVEITGHLGDDSLARLQRNASVFFFPSLYEGFGMPVLDALACGVPVVAADTPAVREVCGRYAFYADGEREEDLAAQLGAAWRATRERPLPWPENARHARESFQWARAGDAYLEIFRRPSATAPRVAAPPPPLALFCPWPPQRTGVADYCFELARHLSTRARLTVFAASEAPMALEGVDVRPIAQFEAEAARHPHRIYHLGNGGLHTAVFDLAWRYPGVIEVHDYNIHPFFVHFYLQRGQADLYREMLLSYGAPGAEAWARHEADGTVPSTWDFPMIDPIVARSTGAIVHSRWVARHIAGRIPVTVNHLAVRKAARASEAQRIEARSALGLAADAFYVGAFGFVNAHKRVDVAATAVGELRAAGYPVHLLLVGEVIDDRVVLDHLRRYTGLGDEGLVATGFVTDDTFQRYLTATDVMVNLRYPTMGESSASLFHAMGHGVPTIVTDIGPFTDVPDWAAWKVPVRADSSEREVAILRAYIAHLLREPAARAELGAGGAAFVSRFADFGRAVEASLAHFTARA